MMEETQPLALGKEEMVNYEVRIRMPSRKIAEIVRNSIEVDHEFSSEIIREINVEDQGVIFYAFKGQYIKYFKKSIKAMYENIQLVLETIKDFSPKE